MQKLTVGYSTLADRVGNIVPPPMQKNWGVSIVIQNPERIAWRGERLAQLMLRDDVEVQELESLGVAKSRNRNIWVAKGEFRVCGGDVVVLRGALIWFSIEGMISLSNTIVFFLGLRLQNTTFSSVSSSLMRFARAKANSF